MRLGDLYPELDQIPGREFTPAEAGALSGVLPEIQRLQRSRLKDDFTLPDAPYEWHEVMQWAIMGDLTKEGLSPAEAWQIASSSELKKLHDYDFRNLNSSPIFVFYRRASAGAWELLMRGDEFKFDPRDPYWGRHFHAFNYSEIQRRVVEAFQRLRR